MTSVGVASKKRTDSSGYTSPFGRTSGWAGKAVVITLAVIGSVVGALPVVLLLGRASWLLILAPVAAMVALAGVWRLDPTPAAPANSEILMAAIAAIGPTASYSFSVILVYWTIYGLCELGGVIVRAFGWHITLSGAEPAHFVGVVLALILIPSAALLTSQGLFRQLFPTAAGLRTPYYRLLVSRRRLLLAITAGAAVVLVFLITVVGSDNRFFYLWLDLYLVYVALPLWQIAERGSRPHQGNQVEDAIKRLLEALGLEVIAQPRTGRPEVDPFLLKADFLALRPERALLIAIKIRTGDQDPVLWTEGSSLISAAWALTDAKEILQLGTDHVDPILVLVGKGPSDSLRQFADTQPIGVVHIADAADLDPALRTEDPVALARLARSVLGSLVNNQAGNGNGPGGERHASG